MRPLRDEESAVLKRLLNLIPEHERPPSEEGLFAVDLEDGGMGSIRLTKSPDQPRKMGRELVTAEYIDEDRVSVLISVNLDEHGQLLELGFWKVDYQPLKKYPGPEQLHIAPPPSTVGSRP